MLDAWVYHGSKHVGVLIQFCPILCSQSENDVIAADRQPSVEKAQVKAIYPKDAKEKADQEGLCVDASATP